MRHLLDAAAATFIRSGIDSPQMEARLLVQHVTGWEHHRLLADSDRRATSSQITRMINAVRRRLKREPLQYITGNAWFFGLEFNVGRGVLIPRPETEMLVEKAIELCGAKRMRILDMGTGSGCIAVALAAALPRATIYASDISRQALKFARQNGSRHGLSDRISFLHGNLFLPLAKALPDGTIDLLIANPPYIPTGEMASLQPEVRWEPRKALDGGRDGLAVIRNILRRPPSCMKDGGLIMLEIGHRQARSVRRIARDAGCWSSIVIDRDLAGIERRLTAVCERS